MRKILKLVLFIPIVIAVTSLLFAYCEGREKKEDDGRFTCLVAGYDEAAENTDVLFVLSYARDKNEISFVQLPRDSFSEYQGSYGKINRIYSKARASGKDKKDALRELELAVGSYLGISFDASLALSFDALVRLVDNVGGVYINIPEGTELLDLPLKLSYGENVLSGKEALKFVRARKNYAGGDLARLDVQKIFLEGLYHTLFERLDAKGLVKLVLTRDTEVTVDAGLLEVSGLLLRDFSDMKNASVALLTLPGEALEYEGVSYFVVNRAAASDAISKYLDGNSFDSEYKFTDRKAPLINEIYERSGFSYKVFSGGKAKDINVD